MKSVNIAMLRSKLSRYLAMVRRGETIEVRDRKTPVARLIPISPNQTDDKAHIPAWLQKLADEGVVRLGTMKGIPEIYEWAKNQKGKHTGAVEALLEERRSGR